MKNRDMPAAPPAHRTFFSGEEATGLTKREAAAIAAMQGVIGNPDYMKALAKQFGTSGMKAPDYVALAARDLSDALFDELEKPHDGS